MIFDFKSKRLNGLDHLRALAIILAVLGGLILHILIEKPFFKLRDKILGIKRNVSIKDFFKELVNTKTVINKSAKNNEAITPVAVEERKQQWPEKK